MNYEITYKNTNIHYNIKNNISKNLANRIDSNLKNKISILITDENIYPLYCSEIKSQLDTIFKKVDLLILPPGEDSKSFESLKKIYDKLAECKLTRSDYIVSLGGGTISDVCGYAASTYMRGINFISIPTTLLAQVDASIGGKTAINIPQGKNLIGSFYHPKQILFDPCFLNTLPDKEIINGMAEVIKYALICDKDLFNVLNDSDFSKLCDEINLNFKNANASEIEQEQFKKANKYNAFLINNIIRRCVHSKIDFVSNDPLDNNVRAKLNFGHTIGHAIEKLGSYSKYSHGEAVAIGMSIITRISEEKGLTKEGSSKAVDELLLKYNLPTTCEYSIDDIKKEIMYDKKRMGSTVNFIVLDKIGHAYIHEASIENML